MITAALVVIGAVAIATLTVAFIPDRTTP